MFAEAGQVDFLCTLGAGINWRPKFRIELCMTNRPSRVQVS